MTCIPKIDLTILKGSTFSQVLRYSQPILAYKAITAVQNSAPCRLTVVGHELPEGWPFWVESVKGMTQINRPVFVEETDISDETDTVPYLATVVDVDTIEINTVNSLDFRPYSGSGTIIYAKPVNLTGCTARMQIRPTVDSDTILVSLTTENGGIVIDASANTITLFISDADTTAYPFSDAVYDLEVISVSSIVTRIVSGSVKVCKEVTRDA